MKTTIAALAIAFILAPSSLAIASWPKLQASSGDSGRGLPASVTFHALDGETCSGSTDPRAARIITLLATD